MFGTLACADRHELGKGVGCRFGPG
jgi:hypothetical protein